MNVPTYSKPIISVSIVERHVYGDAGHFKFFGTMSVDSGEGDDGIAQYDVEVEQTRDGIGAAYWAKMDGETIARAILRDAVVAACEAFSGRVA